MRDRAHSNLLAITVPRQMLILGDIRDESDGQLGEREADGSRIASADLIDRVELHTPL